MGSQLLAVLLMRCLQHSRPDFALPLPTTVHLDDQ